MVSIKGIKDPERVARTIKNELWFLGDLEHMLREQSQAPVYQWIHSWKEKNPHSMGPIVVNMHRRWGKSRTLLKLCVERCIRYPGQEVRFGAPTYKQAQEITLPLLKQILNECPKELYPEKRGSKWTFQNPRWNAPDHKGRLQPSVLTIVSCKEGADDQRGLASDMVVLDECRDIDNFEYVVNDVFSFHFTGRDNPLLVLSSTPPKSQDHAWVTMLDKANIDGRYIEMNVDQNPDFTARDREMLLEVCGSDTTTTWKREALCMRVSDEASLIVPEFAKVEGDVVVEEYKRPEYFFPHICVDFGWVDYSAVLFGYVDFKNQSLVIEDEIVVHYKSLGEIASEIKAKEEKLFSGAPHQVRRFGDNDRLELANLRIDYGLPIEAVNKKNYDMESALAQLRTKFQEGRIKIHSRCKHLLFQLKNGLKDDRGKWVRTERCGHSDAIAALVYLNRMVNWTANPFPYSKTYDPNAFEPVFSRAGISRAAINVTRRPLAITRQR